MLDKINLAKNIMITVLVLLMLGIAIILGSSNLANTLDKTQINEDSDLILANNNSEQTLGNIAIANSEIVRAWNNSWANFTGKANSKQNLNSSLQLNPSITGLNFSFSVWINFSGKTSDNMEYIYASYAGVGRLADAYAWALSVGNGSTTTNQLACFSGNTIAICSVNNVSQGVWTHYAVTWNGTNYSLYLNGVLESTAPQPNAIGQVSAFPDNIGHDRSGDQEYNGTIDELRFYNITLSSTDINLLYINQRRQNRSLFANSNDQKLVLYLPFNENSGTLAHSIGTNKANFTMFSAGSAQNILQNDNITNTLSSGTDYVIAGSKFNITNINYAWSELNVSYNFTIIVNEARGISNNVSQGISNFFDDTDTIFNLVLALIILSAIGIVVLIVMKFTGGGSGSPDTFNGGGKSSSISNGGFRFGGGGSSDSFMGV